MAPPVFTDLGKPAQEVFDKYHFLDIFKLTAKNRTCGNLAMKTSLQHKFDDGTFKGDVEGTYPFPRYGLKVIKKWNTENQIGLAAEIADKIYPGLTLKLGGTFTPDAGKKAGEYSVNFKNCNANAFGKITGGDQDNMMVDTSLVLGYEGWLIGGRLEYDNTEGNVKNHYVSVGHSYGPFQAFLIAQNFSLYTAKLYQRVSDRLEMALCFGTDLGENKKFYNLGCRYLLDDGICLKAKVNNESMVGFSLENTLGGCIKLIFSCLIDGKKLNAGPHKFGLGVDIL